MAKKKNASLIKSPLKKRTTFRKPSAKKTTDPLSKKGVQAIDLAEAIKLARSYLKVIAPYAKRFEVEGVRGDDYHNWVITIGYEGPKEKVRGKVLPFAKKKYKEVTINSKGQLISVEYS